MKEKKGFTLIELLVVISIIALLLAIVMPAFRKAKVLARSVVCRSNLRQWGLIWTLYGNSNDSNFPALKNGFGGKRGHWIFTLREEWQDRSKILLCPSAKKDSPLSPNGEMYGTVEGAYGMTDYYDGSESEAGEKCSYAMNDWCLNTEDFTGPTAGGYPKDKYWQNMDVSGSSRVPLFMDALWRGAWPNYDFRSGLGCVPPDENGARMGAANVSKEYEMAHLAMDRHSGGSNVLLMDMSVSQVKIKHMWKLKWHKDFDIRGYPEVTGNAWPLWMEGYPE